MEAARQVPAPEEEPFCWERCLSDKRRLMDDSGIRAILGIASRPGILSFAGGLPDPKLLPLRQINECVQSVFRDYGATALQYSVAEGVYSVREEFSKLANSRGVECSPMNIAMTTGSQQGIDLVANTFLNRGDSIAVTRPTYLGAVQIFSAFEPTYLEVGCDAEGPIVADVEAAFARRPAFFYVVSVFQNPTGVSVSRERAEAIVKLSHRYEVPIIEDAAYRELFYEKPPTSFRAVESAILRRAGRSYEEHGRVVYLGTFSKVMSPGLRVGWIEAPTPVIRGIACIKQGGDLHSGVMNQLVAAEFIKTHAEEYWDSIRGAYKTRRDQAMESVRNHIGSAAMRCTEPEGGFFLWLELAPSIDTTRLLTPCVERFGVAYAPGAPFFAQNPATNAMRLSFSNLSPEGIERGVKALGAALRAR